MKNLLPFFLLLVLAGCQKSDKLTVTEKRLIGSWFYTNVDFKPNWGFKKDITNEHFGEILTFEKDFTFFLENTETGVVSNGVWQVNQIGTYNTNSSSSTMEEEVIISYQDASSGEIIQLVWDDFYTQKNRINASNTGKDGFYQYELKRF